jgi:hypothetical protein
MRPDGAITFGHGCATSIKVQPITWDVMAMSKLAHQKSDSNRVNLLQKDHVSAAKSKQEKLATMDPP